MHTRVPVLLALSLVGCPKPTGTPQPGPEVAPTKPELGTFGIDLTARKMDVTAGDDFFRHVNGHWLDTYVLKPDEPRYGVFIALRYRSEDRVKAIIEEAAAGAEPGSIEQKIGDYFASYMDTKTRNDKGFGPIAPDLARIDAIADKQGLITAFGRCDVDGTASPITIDISIDRKNSNRYLLDVNQSGLSMPDRDFYLQDEERFVKIRAAFKQHVAHMLRLSGWDQATAEAAAERIFELEKTIAGHHWPRTELRQADKTYNPYTVRKLAAEFSGYDWALHLKALAAPEVKDLNVTAPSAIASLVDVVNDTPLSTWKEYLRYHVISSRASFLHEEVDNANFDFYGRVLEGRQEQRELWKRGVETVNNRVGLGEALGQVYVRKHFPPESKVMMLELVENLRAAYRQRIEALPWLGQETKKEALAKLAAFRPKIGYPDKWLDLSSIHIVRDDLVSNVEAVLEFFHAYDMARLTRPTDKDEWFMTPQTVNAYYNPFYNEIVFPAAILQPPFFDPHADPAVNYGAIGAVIGHEMGHGFDDQGSRFDAKGIQRNWWTDEDRKNFEERTEMLVSQYNQYSPIEGHQVNGELTQGENIGDLGGLSIAYHAYELSLGGKEAPVIDGLTGDQRFFLSWAQVWRSKRRPELTLQRIKSDPHSPPRFRVNGVVRNIDAWYAAFDVTPKHTLYLKPEERVTIW